VLPDALLQRRLGHGAMIALARQPS
jgi:hypothetical protein